MLAWIRSFNSVCLLDVSVFCVCCFLFMYDDLTHGACEFDLVALLVLWFSLLVVFYFVVLLFVVWSFILLVIVWV